MVWNLFCIEMDQIFKPLWQLYVHVARLRIKRVEAKIASVYCFSSKKRNKFL